jgi:hypothetical protein
MRIPAYSPNFYPLDSARRVTELLVVPPAPLSDRYPQQKPSSRPLAERVFEGEILPRPPAAQSLLADYRTSMQARATSRTAAAPDAAPQTAAPSKLLFYQLHSSNESLTDSKLGRHVDQRV